MHTDNRLIVLTGPTGVGKTALSLELAGALDAEIISADSIQVYRGMDIGSAKIRPEEMRGIPHHLIDILDPSEEFNVVLFQKLAREAVQRIRDNGHLPLVVGGTGFYIQALLYDIDFSETSEDTSYRKYLEDLALKEGNGAVHRLLREADPVSAEKIHENNLRRVIRALEFYRETGTRISEHNEAERKKESPYRFLCYCLTDRRDRLYERIDARVDRMVEEGLFSEVKALMERGITREMTSMQGLGYKEVYRALAGEITPEEAIYQIKRDTRHFAKRQLTWFKRERDVRWLSREEYPADKDLLERILSDYADLSREEEKNG